MCLGGCHICLTSFCVDSLHLFWYNVRAMSLLVSQHMPSRHEAGYQVTISWTSSTNCLVNYCWSRWHMGHVLCFHHTSTQIGVLYMNQVLVYVFHVVYGCSMCLKYWRQCVKPYARSRTSVLHTDPDCHCVCHQHSPCSIARYHDRPPSERLLLVAVVSCVVSSLHCL